MIKGITFSLTTLVIFAILMTLTYHWFMTSPFMLLVLIGLESLSFAANIAAVYFFIKLPKWEN